MRSRNLFFLVGSILLLILMWLTFSYAKIARPVFPHSYPHQQAKDLDSGSLRDTLNRTLGFQKIFVINLPYRTDHRDAISLAATLTDIDVEYIDGITEVGKDVLPPSSQDVHLDGANLGAWRAHMNIARTIIEHNITSALVLEDDADWDLRIKTQMREFAKASRLLLQPLPGTREQYADSTYPRPRQGQGPINLEIDSIDVVVPISSPYGDVERWDFLWLGHCGCRFPQASDINVPLGRAVIPHDETVPEKQYIDKEFGDDGLIDGYASHTRVVSRARMNTCSIAYAVSLPGAMRILYELGLNKVTGPTDMMFRSLCHGSEDRPLSTCLTVQPQLFQHHRRKGPRSSFSDISEHEGYNEEAFTKNVRWSTQMNIPKLIDGLEDYIDQYPDTENISDYEAS